MSNTKRTPTNDPVISKIEATLKLRKKTQKELLTYLGINNSNFTSWKYENSKSYMKYIQKIAAFLDVRVEYLLNEEGTADHALVISDEREIHIIETYRNLDSYKKELLSGLLTIMST